MNIIIVGGGQIGAYVAEILLKEGNDIKIIDNRESVMKHLQKKFLPEHFVFADGSSPKVLIESGISKADILVAVTGQDEINLVVSMLAKFEFGVPRVIVRINNPQNKWLFTADMGVDDVVNQAEALSAIILKDIEK